MSFTTEINLQSCELLPKMSKTVRDMYILYYTTPMTMCDSNILELTFLKSADLYIGCSFGLLCIDETYEKRWDTDRSNLDREGNLSFRCIGL